ncbi:cryptochrome/photolyase family protein [Lewinellaceae bacterium SD302]|nr:cryptochrome/photolyase family protein [Lewinellaceae bacterium SD302]
MAEKQYKTLRLILGDQLNSQHSWFAKTDDSVVYCLFECLNETAYVKHHIQKITGFFLAMRAFAGELQAAGHRVIYQRLDEDSDLLSLTDKVAKFLAETKAERFEYQLPDEYRLDEELRNFCADIDQEIGVYDSEHFLSERDAIEKTFAGKKTYLMETFYRKMRQKHELLMDANGEPATDQWNYDHDNRGKLPNKLEIPSTLRFTRDATEIVELLNKMGVETMGRMKDNQFDYPITRTEGLEALEDFCQNRLEHFGTYQDALTVRHDLLFHSRLSFAMNVKLISPLEVCQRVITEWEERPEEIAINQVEGYIRQIIGWREYMRGVYWAQMPGYEEKNHFNHTAKLPDWYWTGATKMTCLSQSINESLDNAYAHHIQRLMVTGNFALLLGAHPDEVDAWYLGVYIDAIQWVEITNTRGMSQWADGGLVATKPYISSANYIHKQGDYCKNCQYDRKARVGEKACPFNSLYWDFLDRHEEELRKNFRMGMIYRVWDRFEGEQKQGILERAAWVKEHVESL